MMRCIAIDDEPLALGLIVEYISRVPFLELAGEFQDAISASSFLAAHEVDLVFTDIQMPGLTGLQFVNSLTRRPMVVFTTAYKKFALDGFDLDVVDYLLKPVSMERFLKACNKAYHLYQLKTSAGNTTIQQDYIFVNVDYSLVKVMLDDISWIEGSGDYIKIHLKNKDLPMLIRMSTKAIETELPSDKFVRIHKSYIVSVASITAVRKNSIFMGDIELPVGETYKEAIKQITRKDM
jgi:two-component system LytT family response regulator